MNLHLDYCKGFGISKEEIEATEEHQGKQASLLSNNVTAWQRFPLTLGPACTAYSRYVLDVGQSEDWISLQVALAPCLLGYGAIAKQLHGNPATKTDGNTYWPWILNYVADDYVQAVKTGSGKDDPHPHYSVRGSLRRTRQCQRRDQADHETLPPSLLRSIQHS